MADLDLRLVRSFLAVVDHQGFGRAADALHLAQPALSRQVQRLEQEVGARLLDRDHRGTSLTEAGRVFEPQARTLLLTADRAVAQARRADRPDALVLGHVGALVVTPVVLEMRRRHPDADVRAVSVPWDGPAAALLDGTVDAVLAREPFPAAGLETDVVRSESRVLVVPLGHRLAGRALVTPEDVAEEPMIRTRDDTWNAFWGVARPPHGPVVRDYYDKLELVASGAGLIFMPEGAVLRDDLVAVPTTAPPVRVLLASREGDPSPLLPEARELAVQLLGARPRLVVAA